MTETLAVAVTGHRPNRLAIGVPQIARQLELVLRAMQKGADGFAPVAVSALAEGADRLFADSALALGYELHVYLPFTSADYETTFADPSGLSGYHRLLGLARSTIELPGTLADSKAGYEAVGHAMVDASDIVVAVWDGKPAAGRGGTPDIIEHALGCGRPVVWVDAAYLRKPVILTEQEPSGATLIERAMQAKHVELPAVTALVRRICAGKAAHRA